MIDDTALGMSLSMQLGAEVQKMISIGIPPEVIANALVSCGAAIAAHHFGADQAARWLGIFVSATEAGQFAKRSNEYTGRPN